MTTTPTDPISPQPLDDAPLPRARRFKWLRLGIGLALFLIVIVFVGRQLREDWKKIPWNDVHFQPTTMALAMGVFLLVRVLNGINIRLLLAAMGVSAPARKVLPIVWVASIGRYIPGKVAVVGGALLMLVRIGVRLPLAMAALFLATAMTMLTGLMASTPLLFTGYMRDQWPGGRYVAMACLAGGLICLFPPIFLRLCNAIMSLLKRPALPTRMRWAPFSLSIVLTMVRICSLGVCLWLAARTFFPLPATQLPYAVGVAGLATTIGFLAVFAPAGLGVHEEIFIDLMQPLMGPQASLLALLVRLLNLLADIVMACAGMLLRQGAEVPDSNLPSQLAADAK
jgi:glycosyltransferase 2 family protein